MKYRYESNGVVSEIDLERQGDSYAATFDGVTYRVEVLASAPGELNLLFDGRPLRLYWAAIGDKKWIVLDGCTHLLQKPAAYASPRSHAKSAEEEVRAPMPAQVRAVLVEPGQAVERGQPLLLLEAMKMEIRLTAPRNGRVAKILAEESQTVQKDQVLIEIGE